jgi:mxaL protein
LRLSRILRARGWLLVLAGLLGAAASILPPVQQVRTVFDHVVVFDITQSMNVIDQTLDGKPASRLHFARHALTSALAKLPCGSKIGIGVFSSRRTLVLLSPVEVCANRFELTQAIEKIDGRMAWEHASLIRRGVFSAIDVAMEWPQPPSLLFITDGQESPPLENENVPPFDKAVGRVSGALVGVGSTTPQPIPSLDSEGRQIGWWSASMIAPRPAVAGRPPIQEHLSALHEAHLVALAGVTGLSYVRLDSQQVLHKALTDPVLAREQVVPTDVRWVPAMFAGLLFVAFYLPRRSPEKRSRSVGFPSSTQPTS